MKLADDNRDPLYICVDFDGTIVRHEFPRIGEAVPLALETLRTLQERGHRLILWTMRDADYLIEAMQFLSDAGIRVFGVNKNPTANGRWTLSPKAYGHLYIDDAAVGCPLITPNDGGRPYVDWVAVQKLLKDHPQYGQVL